MVGIGLSLLLGPGRAAAQGSTDSLAPASVYVPPACAGTPAQRCPLVVFPQVPVEFAHSVRTARAMIAWQHTLADRYGFVLLVQDSTVIPGANDSLLQQTLRTYPVDPDRVALVGYRVRLQGTCPDPQIFSRVALLSTDLANGGSSVCLAASQGSPSRAVQVYIEGGIGERAFVPEVLQHAPRLRQAGHTLALTLTLRGYDAGPDDFERLWHWLDASWATPQPKLPVVAAGDEADPGPLLTPQALSRLTTFWRRFMQLPDSVRMTARLKHQRTITVTVRPWDTTSYPASLESERFTVRLMETPALAAQSPDVQAALKAAGLTASEADAYRRALIFAVANRPEAFSGPVLPTNVTTKLDKNIVFLHEQREALKLLGATGMWRTP